MAKKKKNEKLDVAREVLRDHPDADSRTLARLLHQKYPHHFSSIEVARSKIRYLRGAHGSRHRKVISDKTDFRKHGKTTATAGIEPANTTPSGASRPSQGLLPSQPVPSSWNRISLPYSIIILYLSSKSRGRHWNKRRRERNRYNIPPDAQPRRFFVTGKDCFKLTREQNERVSIVFIDHMG